MTEGVKRTLLTILRIALIILAIFLFTRLWKYIVPFIIAYFFASIIEPVVKFIENKLRIPRKIGTVFSILFVLGIIGSIIGFLISRLIKEIKAVYLNLEINMDTITEFFNRIIDKVNDIFIQLPDQITDLLSKGLQDFANNLQSFLGKIVDWLQASIQAAMYLPQILIFIIVTLLATYFMSSDKNTIIRFLDVQIPTDWLDKTKSITKNVFTALFGWMRAQLILTSITFSELLAGFLIIGIDNALLLAIIISLVDVLPVLGAGTVLIPWSIINLILGNAKLGLSTALLYVIILFVRQLIEPKVLGKQIGVHPLFTLAGMYIGLKLWKVPGMFIGPLAIVSLKYIFEGILKADTFKQWVERNFKTKKKDTASIKFDDEEEVLKKS
ncbi:MAG: sporulation integral membrane protein YtvI [Clostridiaceae bacterium]|jgi:sporulation integral membrane protein YtvI|nr:sporulation integral membrane protein YtvI [Clostridiaceae bacterium]